MKIFISSPGDVDKERRIAERLLDRLKQEFAGRLTIEPYFWEWEPMRLGKNFQAQIPATSLFDLVVCVVWSRIGTPVKAPDGREFPSGTEYEVVSAREAKAVGNKPDVLIYRNLTPAQLRQAPESEYQEHLRQLAALRAFVAKYCVDPKTGVIEGAFTTYQDLGDFELRLEKHLRKLIEEQLPKDGTTPLPEPSWPGSPFRGLEAFDFDHAPIFFGRTRAVGDVLALLRKRMTDVEDARALNPGGAAIKPAAFVLVSAMSGVYCRCSSSPAMAWPSGGARSCARVKPRPACSMAWRRPSSGRTPCPNW